MSAPKDKSRESIKKGQKGEGIITAPRASLPPLCLLITRSLCLLGSLEPPDIAVACASVWGLSVSSGASVSQIECLSGWALKARQAASCQRARCAASPACSPTCFAWKVAGRGRRTSTAPPLRAPPPKSKTAAALLPGVPPRSRGPRRVSQ